MYTPQKERIMEHDFYYDENGELQCADTCLPEFKDAKGFFIFIYGALGFLLFGLPIIDLIFDLF